MEEPILTFIYASQTGNCEEISLELFTTAEEKGYLCERYEFDEHLEKFDLTDKSVKRIVVIICSSTGDGEAPDNGNKFYRYLLKNAKIAKETLGAKKIFDHLRYTILGLGDSDYSSFHKCPKTVNSCFETLGAKLFHYFGKADEATGLELEVEPWKKYFWKCIPKVIEEAKEEAMAFWRKNTSLRNQEQHIVEEVEKEEAEQKPTFKAKISHSKIEADKYRKVMRFEIELDREVKEEDGVKPGSYCLIYPQNDPEVVNEFIQACKWEPTEDLIKQLTHDLDFLQPISKVGLKLLELEDDERFTNKDIEINYLDIVKFKNPELAIDTSILHLIPKMKARYYSLASDLVDTNKFEICFTVEVHEKVNVIAEGHNTVKKGVCSHYLYRLSEEEKSEFEIKLNKISQFATKTKELRNHVPIIFISHGTAIAPFISVLLHFKRLIENKEIDSLGSIDIYYGIRNRKYDFLYEKELTELLDYFREK